MNYNQLSDREFIRYITLSNTDPIVNRFIKILTGDDNALTKLADAGMDVDTWTFTEEGDTYSPGDYIEHLRSKLDSIEDDLWVANRELEDIREERDRLETRTVMDFIKDVHAQVTNAEQRAVGAHAEARRAREEADLIKAHNLELKNKIDVWQVMER